MTGRLVGNLDCEVNFARADAARRRAAGIAAPAAGNPRFALPPAVAHPIAAAATLLRVWARPGDHLWTPQPVNPTRLGELPGLPRPPLVHGPLGALAPAASLAWGETAAVAATRTASAGAGGSARTSPRAREWTSRSMIGAEAPRWQGARSGAQRSQRGGSSGFARRGGLASPDDGSGGESDRGVHSWALGERLWAAAAPTPAAAVAANHRGFALALARQAGLALPGACLVNSPAALERALAAGDSGAWVVKAPLSTAGRSRVRRRGAALDAPTVRRIERLLELFGELLFEPWLERTADFGCAGLIDDDGWRLLGAHCLEVNGAGVFRAIVLEAGSVWPAELAEAERAALAGAAEAAAHALGAAGYRGPFGLDAFRWRDAAGATHFHPLCEINARLTFGLLARGLADWAVAAGLAAPGARVRLRLAVGGGAMPPAGALVLLAPASDDATCAWLELGR